jgi:hypothetical protein
MNSITYIKKITLLLLLASIQLGFGQNGQISDNKYLISIKFVNYTVQMDKAIQKEFMKNDGYKAVYTCIPAGILVIESKNAFSDTEKASIRKKIESVNSSLSFDFKEEIDLQQAEANCASKRIIQN